MDFLEQLDSILFENKTVQPVIKEAHDYGIPDPKPGKTLEDLKKVMKPLENGWTTEEVYSALKPTIISLANRYTTATFSADDAVSMAYDAISDAIKNDEGRSAFTSYVFPYLKTKMRREAARASNLSGVPYSSGGVEDIYAGAKATTSADAPIDDKGGTAISNMPQAEQSNEANRARNLLDKLLDLPSVGLSETEKELLRGLGGMSGDARSVGEIAKEKGISPARVSQVRAKAFQKIKDYLEAKRYKDPIVASKGLGLESKIKRAAEAWLFIIREMVKTELKMIEEGLTTEYYKTIITESINMHNRIIIEDIEIADDNMSIEDAEVLSYGVDCKIIDAKEAEQYGYMIEGNLAFLFDLGCTTGVLGKVMGEWQFDAGVNDEGNVWSFRDTDPKSAIQKSDRISRTVRSACSANQELDHIAFLEKNFGPSD